MRKRGFIVLVASLPLWALNLYSWREFDKLARQWNYEISPGDFMVGTNWAAIIVALAALTLLLIDFMHWLRARHHLKH